MIEPKGIFWEGRAERLFDHDTLPPSYEVAFQRAVQNKLASTLDVSVEQITPEQYTEYIENLLPEREAAGMLHIHQFHRLWPQLLAEAGVEPELTFKHTPFKDRNKIRTEVIFTKSDIPKLLLASAKYDRPETARTTKQLAELLNVHPSFIYDVTCDEGINFESFRDPANLEFDEYLTIESIGKLLQAIKRRKEAYIANKYPYKND